MKHNFTYALILIAVVILSACNKEEGAEPEAIYAPLSEDGLMANCQNTGFATGDKENLYFYNFDQEGIKLYKQNRKTAALTVLDEITTPSIEGGDMLFDYLHRDGEYLYYQPFDVNDNRQYQLYRVKTDGSVKEKVSDDKMMEMVYYKNKVFYTSYSNTPAGLYSMNLDGSNKKLINEDAAKVAVKNDKLYYQNYDYRENVMYSKFFCSNLDGSDPKQLCEVTGYMIYVFVNDRIYFEYGDNEVYSLASMNLDGTNRTELLTGLPFSKLSSDGTTLFVAIPEENIGYGAGIFKYQPNYKMLMPVLREAATYFYMAGDDKIVYGSQKVLVGRFPQLYLTNINGTENSKLIK